MELFVSGRLDGWRGFISRQPKNLRREMLRKTPQEEFQPCLNPKFSDRLPAILDGLSAGTVHGEEILSQSVLAFEELKDFLVYEIDKTALWLAKAEWECHSNPEEVAVMQAWHAKLIAMRDGISKDAIMASVTALDKYTDVVRELLTPEQIAQRE